MLTLATKLMLLLLAAIGTPLTIPYLPLILVAIALTALNHYFNRRRFTQLILALFFLLTLFFPATAPLLSLFFFDGLQHFPLKIWLPLQLAFLALIGWRLTLFQVLYTLILLSAALLLHHLKGSIEALTSHNKDIRDFHEETGQALKLKNKELLDKQDYEIHLATLQERNRIARDIHDNVGHGLSRAILQTGALQAVNQSDALKPLLDGLQQTLTDAMNSIRGSVHDLKDDAIDLEDSAQKILAESPYALNWNYDMTDNIPNPVKYCFLTVLKEALTNTVKHSDADQLQVTLQEHPALYQFLFSDNGTKAPISKNPGIGLQNIEERVQNLGGYCNFTYQNGFKIFITIPKEGTP